MTTGSGDGGAGRAGRLYGGALRIMPPSFRARYRAAAQRDFAELAEAAAARSGRLGVAAATARALADLTLRAPGEWWSHWRGPRHGRRAGRRDGSSAERVLGDLRSAARLLARRPGFTGVVVLTLALGVGATVSIFTVAESVLIRALPFPESHRLVVVDHHAPGLDLPDLGNSGGTANLYWRHGRVFEAFALLDEEERNLVGGERPERVATVSVTPSLFRVLGVAPARGRALTEEDARAGAAPVAVITHRAWVTRFGSDPDVVGSTLRFDGVATEIVGVLPPGPAFPERETVAWTPMHVPADADFGTFGRQGIARMAAGVDLDRARSETAALQPRLPELFPDLSAEFLEMAGWSVTVRPLREALVSEVRTLLWVVLGTAALVLVIAFANVANLFLVRAEGRRKEVAVRVALGAGRGRLAATFLSEGLLLGIVSGLAGLALALLGVRALVAFGPPELPRIQEIGIDGPVALFTVAVSLLPALALGLITLLRHVRGSVAGVLRDGSRGATAGRERHRARHVLVAVQLALALVLLVGSGLMLRSFWQLRSIDPGFDPAGVLAVGVSAGETLERSEAALFYERIVEEVRALPGVTAAGATNSLPLDPAGANGGSFAIESSPRADDALPPVAMNVVVADGFFETMGIPVLQGRGMERGDRGPEAPVAWVNQAFARAFLPGGAVGERIAFDEEEGPWMEVAGVVGDSRHFRLDEDPAPLIYLPMLGPSESRSSLASMTVLVRTGGSPAALAPAVRRVVARLDGSAPVTSVRTMGEVFGGSMARTSFTVSLLGIAAIMALILGAVGVYGVIAYVVSQRTREIGIRMALGAAASDVRRMVVLQGLGVAGAGVLGGVVGALLLTRLLEGLLYGVSSRDPWTFTVVALVLTAVAALASYLPARRASRVDPVQALGAE